MTVPIKVATPTAVLVMIRSGMTGKGMFASPVTRSSVPADGRDATYGAHPARLLLTRLH
jgi:hypothetical protein